MQAFSVGSAIVEFGARSAIIGAQLLQPKTEVRQAGEIEFSRSFPDRSTHRLSPKLPIQTP